MANHRSPAVIFGLLCAGASLAHAQGTEFAPYEFERASVGLYEYVAVASEGPAPVAKPLAVTTSRTGSLAAAGVPGDNSKPVDTVDAVKTSVVPRKIGHQLK